MSVWQELAYFNKSENWGDYKKIASGLLLRLDAFRAFVGVPVVITCGTQGVHAKGSQHYMGNAVDVVVPKWSKDLFDLFLCAERFDFSGIGVYPHWKYNDHVVGGLHLDVRVQDLVRAKRARWMGVLDDAGKQEYVALNSQNIRKYILGESKNGIYPKLH